ncbi:efflux RND transporter periplasmic adaptor subunit [Fibrobacter sp.]|uniref:efflux RND transporter periplasmic adaptor subunit n=3 Tax=Fibrobacter TaxID=832 RepID=UPI0025B8893A|nr:efflux RND transporter periplasmic adaptor subunit [Fibrobacter sp.]MBS7271807.1 efflux RND transporter periplasmic adaptor subunit [Fibrobacter sp.]MCI6436696.1 efflux RND transporter periplasmic adaptor subunit [Fibrobacter sp.]
MNKTLKTLLTLATASMLLVACNQKDEAKNNEPKKASTIEEIQKEKGKPARVVKASKAKLTDVRKYSGTIEGMNQNSAICKMGDPIAKINVQVGSSVQKDQVLAEYLYTGDNTQYQQAQEQIAVLEKATERMREVYQKGGISQQDMDAQEMQLKVAKMNLEAARRATLILAPEAGVVTELKYQVGQTPGVGAKFATIAKLNKVILKLNITSQDIGYFKKGAAATVTIAGEKIKGNVSLIPLAANPATRFFPVEVTFNNKGKKLLPGMYVTAELDARQVNGVAVPTEAVVYRNGSNAVWIVDEEGKARRKLVKLGIQTKDFIQIAEGLEGNESVIVEGMSRMNDGDKVLVVE